MKHLLWSTTIVTTLALSLSACLINESSAADAPLNTLDHGNVSGIHSQRFEVIRDATSLEALWREHTAVMEPPLALPQVDFEHDMVIAAFLGLRGTPGYGLQIIKLSHEGDAFTVHINATGPGEDCVAIAVPTWPYHIVVTPRQAQVISFQVNSTTHDCN